MFTSIALVLAVPATAAAQARFITVDQDEPELNADRALARDLGVDVIEAPEKFDYDVVIDYLIADERKEGTIARVTPYALVAAEMRGARLEPIATCRSKNTRRTVINAFLVVRKADVPSTDPSGPTLSQVLDYLRKRPTPAQFIYHNKLSTSSFFLPSLFFRAQRVFDGGGQDSSSKGITTVRVKQSEIHSSSELVKAVAKGDADVASIWNNSKSRFEDKSSADFTDFGSKVWFVQLATDLPCDVLVATRKVDETTKQRIRDKLPVTLSDRIPKSDVDAWVLWSHPDALDAHDALSDLRRQAAASTVPVIVDVRNSKTSPVAGDSLDAVRHAIRLAGTELIDKSEYYDYYVKTDTLWNLEQIHDGAVRIAIRYDNFKLGNSEVSQQFDVSFLTADDLTQRMVSLIHSRLHRIRQVWLYRDAVATVLRDVGFDVAKQLPLHEIEWDDPQRNNYTVRGSPGEATVKNGFNFELESRVFPQLDGKLALQPMGRRSFRVLLMRPDQERTLFRALSVAVVLFFGLAGLGLVWDFRRWHRGTPVSRRSPPAPSPPAPIRVPDPASPPEVGPAIH
jgi:ABC-type phosphate/phosphonate transport system substrate-binding protein